MQLIFPSRRCSFSRPSGNANAAFLKAAAVAALLLATFTPALAQERAAVTGPTALAPKKPGVMPGALVIPPSNYAVSTGTTGKTRLAHTNLRVLAPATASPLEAPPQVGYAYETPASMACIYGLVTASTGCNPMTVTADSTYGYETIAIVDAYDDPNAPSDLAYFSDVFGLPFNFEKFNVVYENETQPYPDETGGWELEESLDIEYAHAMAPNATLYLVEAQSNSDADLFTAVQIATNLVKCGLDEYDASTDTYGTCPTSATGKGEVSMSWGGAEFAAETAYDSYMNVPNVVFVASSGDESGTLYPSVSPYVVSAGGTSNARSLVIGNLIEQIAWSDAGGGVSEYEPIPTWQSGNASVKALAGTHRDTPDVSADADPYTGVWVYDSFPMDYFDWQIDPSNWWIVGGTSVAAPTITGIINASESHSGAWSAGSTAELTLLYTTDYGTSATYAADFTDITYGACNYYKSSFSGTGYDDCTGLGTFKGLAGK